MKKAEEQPVAAIGSRRAVRVLGIAVIAAIEGLIVSYGAMTIGYILVVVVLSTFFLIVAFDVGVPKRSSDVAGE